MSTGINDRALQLLGSGVNQEAVASALGVSPSYISQLLADENFAKQVTQIRFETLSKHSARDAGYDDIEDLLQQKLKKSLALIIKPRDILDAIKTINGAKRRGHDNPDNLTDHNNLVQITMPVQIIQKFTTNVNNQVIKAGEQELLTMPSGELLKKAESKPELPALENEISEEDNKVLSTL